MKNWFITIEKCREDGVDYLCGAWDVGKPINACSNVTFRHPANRRDAISFDDDTFKMNAFENTTMLVVLNWYTLLMIQYY